MSEVAQAPELQETLELTENELILVMPVYSMIRRMPYNLTASAILNRLKVEFPDQETELRNVLRYITAEMTERGI